MECRFHVVCKFSNYFSFRLINAIISKKIARPHGLAIPRRFTFYDNASSEYEKERCLTKIGNFRYRADKLVGKTENGGIDNILGEFCEICNSVIYKLSRLD